MAEGQDPQAVFLEQDVGLLGHLAGTGVVRIRCASFCEARVGRRLFARGCNSAFGYRHGGIRLHVFTCPIMAEGRVYQRCGKAGRDREMRRSPPSAQKPTALLSRVYCLGWCFGQSCL